MFGKLIASVIEGAIDTAELTVSVASDTVKSPVRVLDKISGSPYECEDDLLADTKEKIAEIKER